MGLLNRKTTKETFEDSKKRIEKLDKILVAAIREECYGKNSKYKIPEIMAALLIVANKINSSDMVAYYEQIKKK